MKVGHGSATLSVVLGEPLGGYADRSDGVVDVLDPLEVHVTTFADDVHRFALVTADLVCVNTDVVASVRSLLRRRLPVDSCWVAATHTHASPEAGCVPGGSRTPRSIADRLVASAAEAAREAIAAEVPVALDADRTFVEGFAGRRNGAPSAALDLPIDALHFTVGDEVVGSFVVSPVHPTILSADNNHVSADLNGGIRRALSGNGRWAVVATGAAGDISTRHTRRSREVDEIGRLGRMAAEQVDAARPRRTNPVARGIVNPPVSQVVRLQPKRPAEVEELLRGTPSLDNADERSRWVLEQGRRIAGELASHERLDPYVIDVQAIGLDTVTLVAVPGELYLELGEAIRSAATVDGRTVVVLGYANGYLGYLPTHDAPSGYETYASPVTAGSGEIVVAAAVDAASRCISESRRADG